ncbi:hypothetical protein AB0M47_28450 [Hamadaea sp. NPDC051192]|uniref:hypothetical protein n=1 Tax=Hamadaea sp. NPDC051192 TaxID=3154940 RepID=UPI00344AE386
MVTPNPRHAIRLSGHAYPWDCNGDPAFADRVRDHGLEWVTLAAAYHSTRAATPLHPGRQLVDAHSAALYRPVRDVWRRLRPIGASWLPEPDPFGQAARGLRRKGLKVSAWIVLTHNTRLGREHPDVSVVNCFGERYPYALCPAHEEVRDYAATLAAEALHDVEVDAVSLEACGQLGLVHLSQHEKTDDAWTPLAQRLLSVCCCAACRSAWSARGLDAIEVVAALRAAVRSGGDLTPETSALVLAARQQAADQLRAAVLQLVREKQPTAEVTLHGHPDPWATGASPGLTPTAAADVAAVLVPCWPVGPGSYDLVERAAAFGSVDAYLTVLPPAGADAVVAHGQRLVAAGADRISLYHLGLAAAWRQPLFTQLVAALSGGRS